VRKISFTLLAFALVSIFFACDIGIDSSDENDNGGNNSESTGEYSNLEGAWEYLPEESSNDLFYKAYFDSDSTLYIYGRDINDTLYLEKKMSISDVTTDAFQYSSLLEEGSCSYTIENDKMVLVWDSDNNETYALGKITESVPLGIKYYLLQEDNPSISADIEARNWWTQAGYSFFVLPQSANLNGLKPTIELTNGATVTPGSLVSQNLSSPVIYSFSKDGVTKTQTLVAFQPDEDSNMLINGDFSYGSLFWDVWNTPEDGGAEVNMEVVDGVVHLEFDGTAQAANWLNGFDTTLEGTSLYEEGVYQLSVDAWGSGRPFCLYLNEGGKDLNGDDNNYTTYFSSFKPIEVARNTYAYTFRMIYPTDNKPAVGLLLSDSTGEVYIDNFALRLVSSYADVAENIELNTAVFGEIVSINQVIVYSVSVDPETSYSIVWDDFSTGSDLMTADIIVSAVDQELNTYLDNQNSGNTDPIVFETEANASTVYIIVDTRPMPYYRKGSFALMLSSN